MGTMEGPLPLHFADRLPQSAIAALFVGSSIVVGLTAVAAGRFPPRPMLAVSVVLLPLGLGAAGAADSLGLWIAALAVAAVGFGTNETGSLGILLEWTGTQRIVTAMVVWSIAFAAGYLVGPAVAGAVAQFAGYDWVVVVPAAGAVAVLLAWRPARSP